MTIGIDANQANKPGRSGVEWYSFHLIQALKKIGPVDVEFRLYSSGCLTDGLERLPANWQSRVLRWFNIGTWNLWTQLRLSFELLIHPPDVFLSLGYTLPLLHPKKSIVVVHDVAFVRYPEYYAPVARYFYKLILRYTLSYAVFIIVPSEFTKQEIIKLYDYPTGKMQVIAPSHDNEKYKLRNSDAHSAGVKDKYKIKRPYIMFVGRLIKNKNIIGLVKAYHQSIKTSPIEFDLLLIGQQMYGWDEVADYIRQNNLAEKVLVPGYVDAADLPILYSQALAYVTPSLYEGFGLTVLEAMACGCPVICSNTTALPEAAGAAAEQIDPNNISAIANAIVKVVSDNKLQAELKAKGLARAQNFTWEKGAGKFLQVLTNLN